MLEEGSNLEKKLHMREGDFQIVQVGCGYWGANLARTFNERGCLKYLSDISNDSANILRNKINKDIKIILLEDAISNDSIDAMSIATPAETHYSIAKKSLNHGKHVYIEKPVTLISQEAEDLRDIAKEKSLVIQVGHLLLYHPAIDLMADLIRDGKIGDIKYIYSNRLSLGKFREHENVAWSFMPHDISLLNYFIGSPIETIRYNSTEIFSVNNQDIAHLWINYENGAKGHIFASWCNPFKEHKLVIIGDKGAFIFEDSADTEKLKYIDSEIITNHGNIPTIKCSNNYEAIPFSPKKPLDIACEEFVMSCKTGLNPKASIENGIEVVKVLEETDLN